MKLRVLSVVAASLSTALVAWGLPAGAIVAAAQIPALAATQAETQPAGEKPAQPDTPAPAQPGGETPQTEEKLVYVKMSTTVGTAVQPDIILELNKEKAPISVENFVKYVEKGYYDGTIFHRVIPTFMIQGGGFNPDMTQKEAGLDKPIKNEWRNGLKNVRGSIAMARTSVADSATSQFFINVRDNPFLNEPNDGAGYAVFGKVVAGMAAVDKIKGVSTTIKAGHKDVPVDTVKITKTVKITAEDAAKAIEAEKSPSGGGENK